MVPGSPGVSFINFLRADFVYADPKSTKKTNNLTVFFALSGSARVKAVSRMLMKLTPGPLSVIDANLYKTNKQM